MTVATCITAELRGLAMGDGTVYTWDSTGIDGLGHADFRNNDVARGHGDGDVGQNDFYGPRSMQLSFAIGGNSLNRMDQAAVWSAFESLRTAWAKSDVDIPLTVGLPGQAPKVFMGRPRGLRSDLSMFTKGLAVVRAQCIFVALDPSIY